MQCPRDDRNTQNCTVRSLAGLMPLASMAAMGIMAFLYCVALLSLPDLSLKVRDSALFLLAILALPPFVVFTQLYFTDRAKARRQITAITIWFTAFALLGLALTSILVTALGSSSEGWTRAARILLFSVLASHVIALCLFGLRPQISRLPLRVVVKPSTVVVGSIACYAIAAMILFKVDPTQPYFSPFMRNFVEQSFGGPAKIAAAAGFALAMVGATCVIYVIESALLRRRSAALRTMQVLALCLAIALTFIAYFDFSLNLDPVHYLTIAGPATHVLHGATLMVDAFSQYGPGPVLVAICALLVGPQTLASVQIAAQLSNLAYCAIWLVCLFRMTRWKATASLIGFVAIAVPLACWDYGNGNVNVAPSILGLRYFPALCMVLSISCLRPPARLSIFTSLCTALAGLWSVESLVGTLGIHLSTIVMLNLRARTYQRLLTDSALAASPILLSIVVLGTATVVRSGTLPDYRTYLAFLVVYNPTSSFWSRAADSQFLAWMTMLLSVFLVLCAVWRDVFGRQSSGQPVSALYYKFLPMAALAAVTAAYYVFRSYDYTLLIAFLPFAGLAIPAILDVANRPTTPWQAVLLAIIPGLICISTLMFCWLALTRADAPYSFLLQQCRDHGRCTAPALFHGLEHAARLRLLMERTGNSVSDRYLDDLKTSQSVSDAVRLIQRGSAETRTTVLLGETVASELALLYTGRWQRWPISFAFTDALVPALAERIVAAPVALKPGELVIVRRDHEALQMIEAGILRRIQSEYDLCPIADTGLSVNGYRVAVKGSPCPR